MGFPSVLQFQICHYTTDYWYQTNRVVLFNYSITRNSLFPVTICTTYRPRRNWSRVQLILCTFTIYGGLYESHSELKKTIFQKKKFLDFHFFRFLKLLFSFFQVFMYDDQILYYDPKIHEKYIIHNTLFLLPHHLQPCADYSIAINTTNQTGRKQLPAVTVSLKSGFLSFF